MPSTETDEATGGEPGPLALPTEPGPSEGDQEAESEEAFDLPEFQPDPAMEELGAAMSTGRWGRAAELLTKMLSVAPGEHGFAPVWQALECATELIEAHDSARAKRLITLLDRHIGATGMRAGELGAHTIARWALIQELLSLKTLLDDDIVSALARGVRDGNYERAAHLLSYSRVKEGALVEHTLSQRAPSLHAVVWPLVKQRLPSRHFGSWHWFGVAFLLLQAVKFCGSSVAERSETQARSNVAPPPAAGAQPARFRSPDPSPADLGDSKDAELTDAARTVDEALTLGDCATVREYWPTYLGIVRTINDDASRVDYGKRQARAMPLCIELAQELLQSP